MNIVVLAGGLSPERDVSLSTGVMVVNALRSVGHRAILVDLFFGVEQLPSPIENAFCESGMLPPRPVPAIAPDLGAVSAQRKHGFSAEIGCGVLELCRAADLTYLALHGGCGENGSLQSLFDLCGIRYTGSPAAGCVLAMDKYISKKLLDDAGVLTPKGALLHRGVPFDASALPLPCVVKPCCGGSSIGITIVRNFDDLSAAIEAAFQMENAVLVEEYVEGRELSAGVLGGEALPLIEIVPRYGFYDYQHKYQPGWTEEITPGRFDAETTKRIQSLAVKGFSALHLSVYARLDFLLTADGRAYCLEANTLPGMTPTSLLPQEAAVVGYDYPALCSKIINLSMEKYLHQ